MEAQDSEDIERLGSVAEIKWILGISWVRDWRVLSSILGRVNTWVALRVRVFMCMFLGLLVVDVLRVMLWIL